MEFSISVLCYFGMIGIPATSFVLIALIGSPGIFGIDFEKPRCVEPVTNELSVEWNR